MGLWVSCEGSFFRPAGRLFCSTARACGEPQPKKPLLEKTKELRGRLKSLTPHEQVWNVPNVLTFSRLVAAPAVGYLILQDQHAAAFGLFAYAGITDLVDGWIARRWKLQTVVGSVVDPMADKLLMAITVGCLAAKGALPGPLAILIFGRDASLAVAAIYYRYASLPLPKTLARYWDFSLPSAEVHPTTISKWNTFLQLALIGLTLSFPLLAIAAGPADVEQQPAITTTTTSTTTSRPAPPAPASSHDDPAAEKPTYASFLHSPTTDPRLKTTVSGLQLLVGATTLWSGFSYAVLKNAVTILGTDERLKARQGARGRAVVGVSFALVCAAAVGWGLREWEGGQRRVAEEEWRGRNGGGKGEGSG
ncbi:uncharacterized protein K452DRAFT_286695 [Aplosporella prunicola CBS 121167]|uniref:Uncharacterized protein n=1 Tax=Aplosporella prunicola CBS 121167 TaxID=1176127 RepID=A0A6A6BG62_9PEZI|nr:uncharacterized protein K452DRAFT_286695 [Aplosporella prunicola CBS 121167]KAF2143066.1 hypothetical protein K452DRAFT_286695 [Aplosporella prunicola CBS 121167]